jgi:2-methylcitrate dehydratase PrpD
MPGSSVTGRLADFACAMDFGMLSAAAVDATRDLIRDTLGCVIAGRSAPSTRIVASVLEAYGGARQATVLGSGVKLPAALAAHLNAHSGNALDADDTVLYKAHIGSAVVPAALAIAEREGCSGRDLITAVAAGYEVAGRIGLGLKGLSVDEAGRFRFGPVTGYSWVSFAASVAAGRLLRLDPLRMRHAFALTAAMAPLPGATRFGASLPRPMSKYALYGAMAEAGIHAALYAAGGFTGEPDVLDGDQGLWRIVGALGCDWEAMQRGLDAPDWLVERACYKIYPTCRFLAGPLDMLLDVVHAHALQVSDIAQIRVRVPEAGLLKHQAQRTEVENIVDCGFSLPYAFAVALLAGPPGPAWLDEHWRSDAALRAFAARIHVSAEPTAAAAAAEDLRTLGYNRRMRCTLELEARGRVYTAQTDYARGDHDPPEMRLSAADHVRKFRTFCAGQLPAARTEEALRILARLEHERSVAGLVDNLVA